MHLTGAALLVSRVSTSLQPARQPIFSVPFNLVPKLRLGTRLAEALLLPCCEAGASRTFGLKQSLGPRKQQLRDCFTTRDRTPILSGGDRVAEDAAEQAALCFSLGGVRNATEAGHGFPWCAGGDYGRLDRR